MCIKNLSWFIYKSTPLCALLFTVFHKPDKVSFSHEIQYMFEKYTLNAHFTRTSGDFAPKYCEGNRLTY